MLDVDQTLTCQNADTRFSNGRSDRCQETTAKRET